MRRPTSDWIAIILSGGLSLSVVVLVTGVVIAAIEHGNTASSLSENESQVLTAAFGGMIGVLGAWVGYHVREHRADPEVLGVLTEPDDDQPTGRKEWPQRRPEP